MAQDPRTSQDEVQHLPVDSTETLPLLTTADPEQQDSSISDEEAYAKLKAKRAERAARSSSVAALSRASSPASYSSLSLRPPS